MLLIIIQIRDYDYNFGKFWAEKYLESIFFQKMKIVKDEYNAPYIESNGYLNISISHTRNYYCLAVSRKYSLGIDAEEYKRFQKSNYSIELFEKWMMFEALFKSRRKGKKGDFKYFNCYAHNKRFLDINLFKKLKIIINYQENYNNLR